MDDWTMRCRGSVVWVGVLAVISSVAISGCTSTQAGLDLDMGQVAGLEDLAGALGDGGALDLALANDALVAGDAGGDGAAAQDDLLSLDLVSDPTLVATDPSDASSGIAIDAAIVLSFSEPMDAASVAAAFSATPTIDCTWMANGNSLTCTHAALAYATSYALTLDATALSLRGPALTTGSAWSFTTVSEPAPNVTGVTIEGYGVSKQVAFSTGAISIDLTGEHLEGVTAASFVSQVPSDTFAGPISASVASGATATALVLNLTVPDADTYPIFDSSDNPHAMDLHLTTSHGDTVVVGALVLTSITAGPSGNDTTGKGTPDAPFRSLKQCLSRAHGADTIHLLAGTYNENNGESWLNTSGTVSSSFSSFPGPIRILGDGVDTTIVTTTSSNRLPFFVGPAAASNGVRFDNFSIQGFHTGVSISKGGVELRGRIANSTTSGVFVGGTANLYVNGGEVMGNGTGCCTLSNQALYSGVYASGSGTITFANANVHDNAAAGLYVRDTVTVQLGLSSKFNRTNYNPANGTALYLTLGSTLAGGIVVDGGSSVVGGGGELAQNRYGIIVASGAAAINLGSSGSGYNIHNNRDYGILMNGSGTLLLRRSTVTNNGAGGAGLAAGSMNLGYCVSQNDPGANTFSGNTTTGYDLIAEVGTIYSCGTALAGTAGTASDPYPNHSSVTTISNPSATINDGTSRWQVKPGASLVFNQQ